VSRRLVAALAVRNNGTRMYGKPLQRLAEDGPTILAQSIAALRTYPLVDDIVLGIADGPHNTVFESVARELEVRYVYGSEHDVLGRLITCAAVSDATDVFRKTTEDPYMDYDMLEPAWRAHVDHGNDATALDMVPEGTAFELFTLDALERSHAEGLAADREHISDYVRFNQAMWQVEVLEPAPDCRRLDLRLTVDNPQDLIVVREVWRALGHNAPRIPLREIVAFLDSRPDLVELVAPYNAAEPTWLGLEQRPVPPLDPS
jgi:spore coat polysaccharide biosynthesis protein SpsF